MRSEQQQHILIVAFPAQSHINPALHLAKRLTRVARARITISTAAFAHHHMFPTAATPDQEVEDGLISYIPFSHGDDNGLNPDHEHLLSQFKLFGSNSLSAIIDKLATRDRPVTCIIYTVIMTWAAAVAHKHGIPSALFWIQPATVFAICHRYFHGYGALIASHAQDPSFVVNLPGLPPLEVRDLPTSLNLTQDPSHFLLTAFQEMFEALAPDNPRSKPRVLVNTFDELEAGALSSINEIELFAIGPVLPFLITANEGANAETDTGCNLFKQDEKGYMEWLDYKPKGSVVYVSFGSVSTIKKRQMEEMLEGIKESGRPYLWVVRKDNRGEGVDLGEDGEAGMVVEWCSQFDVLSHLSVGCFVTHCGWNSTLESVACGVPTVCVPQRIDQPTNAWLMATVWGTGVRGELDSDGVLPGRELSRCLEIVMGEGERGVGIRRNAKMWIDRALEAVKEGGTSDRNLKVFCQGVLK